MSDKTPQELLSPAIVAARTAAQREALAAELERIAGVIRATAQAIRRQQARPPDQRVAPKHGKGGRPSTPWIEVQTRARAGAADTLLIRLSTSVYYAAGSPDRLDVQRIGNELRLIPARGDVGYKAMVNAGGIRINVSGSRDVVALEVGKYAAAWRGGAIVVGERLEKR